MHNVDEEVFKGVEYPEESFHLFQCEGNTVFDIRQDEVHQHLEDVERHARC